MPKVSAHRTLLKSAPELWAQVADPEGLARRLPGVQDIRIVRARRQRHIAWEGEQASGEVILEPAGFGTKVTLTVAHAERQRSPAGQVSSPEGSGSDAGETRPKSVPTSAPAYIRADQVTRGAPAQAPPARQSAIEVLVEPAEPAAEHPADPGAAPDPPSAPTPRRRGFLARIFRPTAHSVQAPVTGETPTPRPDSMHAQPTELFEAVDPGERDLPDPGSVAASRPRGATSPEEDEYRSATPGARVRPLVPAQILAPATAAREESATESRSPVNEESGAGVNAAGTDETAIGAGMTATGAGETAELLEAALDSLGTNHHRPFSRG